MILLIFPICRQTFLCLQSIFSPSSFFDAMTSNTTNSDQKSDDDQRYASEEHEKPKSKILIIRRKLSRAYFCGNHSVPVSTGSKCSSKASHVKPSKYYCCSRRTVIICGRKTINRKNVIVYFFCGFLSPTPQPCHVLLWFDHTW